MLQLIGWLGCTYLVVKGLEIVGSAPRKEDGEINTASYSAAAVAFLGAVGFASAFWLQGSSMDRDASFSRYQSTAPTIEDPLVACVAAAETDAEVLAC